MAVGPHKYILAPKSGEGGFYVRGGPDGTRIYVTPLLPGVGPDEIEPDFNRQRRHLCGWPGRPSGLLWDALGEREWGIRRMLG